MAAAPDLSANFLEFPLEISSIVAIVAFGSSYVASRFVFRLATRFELFDQPGARRIHRTPTPRLGGVAVLGAILMVAGILFVIQQSDVLSVTSMRSWGTILPGCLIVAGTGLLDDLRHINAIQKLSGQILAAGLFVLLAGQPGLAFGYDIPQPAGFLLQVLWIIAVINAFNLIDGIDGLATALGVVAHLGILSSLILRGAHEELLVVIASMCALAGFYPWNRHPAKMFLGDGGTHICGYLIGCLAISTGSKSQIASTLWISAIAGVVPLTDMLFAVWRRSARKLSSQVTGKRVSGIFTGDLEHVHHRLLDRGMDVNTVVAVLTLVNSLIVLIGLVAVQSTVQWYPIIIGSLTFALVLLLTFIPRTEIAASIEVINLLLVHPRSRVLSCIVFVTIDTVSTAVGWLIFKSLIHGNEGLLSVDELLPGFLIGALVAVVMAIIEGSWRDFGMPIVCTILGICASLLWSPHYLLLAFVVALVLTVPRGLTFLVGGFGSVASSPRSFGFYSRLTRR